MMDQSVRRDLEAGALKVFARHPEVIAAYIYGSVSKGLEHAGSDLDIAVLLSPDYEADARYGSRLALELEDVLNREVDASVLNDAKISFQHQVLRYGVAVFSRDDKARAEFESRVYSKYLDIKPFFETYDRIRRRMINETG